MDDNLTTLNNLELEMPWFKWCKKATGETNFKSKVEQKLLMARQDPEPIFDLTDCNLLDVPFGVYSWCKVCLKQTLLLQNNRLKSINGGGNISDLFNLRILNLSHNNLTKIPEEICLLPNIQALYLHFNLLKSLPEALDELKNLQVLNMKSNRLKDLPHSLCRLPCLRKLDISLNLISRLPNEFVDLKELQVLVIDEDVYEYPPIVVCKKGLRNIMEFLCQENGKDFCPRTNKLKCSFALESGMSTGEEEVRTPLANQQDQHQQALLESEKNLQELYEKLFKSQQTKQAFLKDLIKNQDRMDEKLSDAQNKKDKDHQKLLGELLGLEQESNLAIEELLEIIKLSKTKDVLLEMLENDRREFEKLFLSVQNESLILSRKEVIKAMETTLENQYREAQSHLAVYKGAQKELLATTQLKELSQALKLEEIITKSGQDQDSLIAQILQDEEYQKRAFAGLMMKRDREYTRLSEQILLVENELANLTLQEMRRKDLKLQTERNILEDQRGILTDLLLQLIVQQEDRSKEFEKRLYEIESQRSQEHADFWLRQYQRLLESKPDIFRQAYLQPEISMILKRARVSYLEPIFVRHNVSVAQFMQLDDRYLQKLGIGDSTDREAVLKEIESYSEEASSSSQVVRQQSLSFRARFEVECVVCMENKCTVLYLNCGHVCCCANCAPTLRTCPMCRATIERILLLTHIPSAPSFEF